MTMPRLSIGLNDGQSVSSIGIPEVCDCARSFISAAIRQARRANLQKSVGLSVCKPDACRKQQQQRQKQRARSASGCIYACACLLACLIACCEFVRDGQRRVNSKCSKWVQQTPFLVRSNLACGLLSLFVSASIFSHNIHSCYQHYRTLSEAEGHARYHHRLASDSSERIVTTTLLRPKLHTSTRQL